MRMLQAFRSLVVPALFLAASFTGGCANTIQSISLPTSATWTTMVTGIASEAETLSVVTTGAGIDGNILSTGSAYRMCGDANGRHVADDEGVPCREGLTDYGVRYLQMVAVRIDKSTFQGGSVQVISDTDGSTVAAFAVTTNASGQLNLTAGMSDGTVPVKPSPAPSLTFVNGKPADGLANADAGSYELDNHATIVLSPADPGFAAAEYRNADNELELGCYPIGTQQTYASFINTRFAALAVPEPFALMGDVVEFDVAAPRKPSYACGDITINFTSPKTYKSVGECIADTRKTTCAGQGLKGTALAACNAAVIGTCQASFNVPSKLANAVQ